MIKFTYTSTTTIAMFHTDSFTAVAEGTVCVLELWVLLGLLAGGLGFGLLLLLGWVCYEIRVLLLQMITLIQSPLKPRIPPSTQYKIHINTQQNHITTNPQILPRKYILISCKYITE